jgi:TRAP-type C4-dicarboxylate transport system permease small subunit
MKRIISIWLAVGKSTQSLAGATIIIMFLVTLFEVFGRLVWRPIPGAWEMISFLGGIVIGLSIPYTSQKKAHVNVDFLINRMPKKIQNVTNGATRLIALTFFGLVGFALISMGIDYKEANEVSTTMKIPFYPLAIGMGVVFFVQAVQFLLDFLKICGGSHE